MRELYTQFLIRIFSELHGCKIGQFSTLKALQAPNFKGFRDVFTAKLLTSFLVPANTFDNVSGKFPIGFFVWDTNQNEKWESFSADVYNADGELLPPKTIVNYDAYKLLTSWNAKYNDKTGKEIAWLRRVGSDTQNNKGTFITNFPSPNDVKKHLINKITKDNLLQACVYLCVRQVIKNTWLNDRDQFLHPLDSWETDTEFQTNCLAYTLFCNANNIRAQEDGTNHWIPFTEREVDAKDRFASHFMTDYISGKNRPARNAPVQTNSLTSLLQKEGAKPSKQAPLQFSAEAQAVFAAGKKLWRYYHAQDDIHVNASLYDIKEYFQGRKPDGKLNTRSEDETYNDLMKALRDALQKLADRIEPKIYEHGFLK